jgi:hypothetical protein
MQMGVLERIQNKGLSNRDSLPGLSPTTEQADSPVFLRIAAMMNYTIGALDESDNAKIRKFRKMLELIAMEALEELRDAPGAAVEHHFARSANLMIWAATGRKDDSLPWPKDFEIPDALAWNPKVVEEIEA